MRLATLAMLALVGLTQPGLAAADPACTAEIRELMLASVQSGPFQMISTMSGPTGEAMTNTLRMVPPASLHWVSTLNGAPNTEMLFLDGRGYMKMRGAWADLPPMPGNLLEVYSPASIEKTAAQLVTAECAIPADWEGKPALRYVFTTSAGDTVTDITMWIDARTRLPIHNETAYTVAGEAMTATTDYTYDPDITVDVAP